MATGGDTMYSCCSSCLDDGRNTVARHYCVDCEMYFCTKCVKYHNKIPSLKTHQVNEVTSDSTDADDDLGSSERGSDSVRISTCTLHQGKPIDTHCKDHDEVCCGACAVVKHRSCLIVPIVIAAKEFKASPDKCITALTETTVKFNAEKKKRVENLDCIGKQNLELIENVNKYEGKVIVIIKLLANISRKEIRSKYEEHKAAIDTDIEALDVGIATNTEYTKQFNQRDEEQQFIYVKTNKTVITDGERLLQEMTKGWRKRDIGFSFDKTLDTHIRKMTSLGRLEEEYVKRDRGDKDRDMDRDSRKRKFGFEQPVKEDEARSRSNAKTVTERYRGWYAEMEKKAAKEDERINKKLKLKTKNDSYAECYPGTSTQYEAPGGSNSQRARAKQKRYTSDSSSS